jgi:hypothetical protein
MGAHLTVLPVRGILSHPSASLPSTVDLPVCGLYCVICRNRLTFLQSLERLFSPRRVLSARFFRITNTPDTSITDPIRVVALVR